MLLATQYGVIRRDTAGYGEKFVFYGGYSTLKFFSLLVVIPCDAKGARYAARASCIPGVRGAR